MRTSLRAGLAAALTVAVTVPLAVVAGASPAPAETTAATTSADELAGYVFPYFTGESTADGETIRLAVSEGNDPLDWQTLNAGDPILSSTLGTTGLRDPFLLRSAAGDKFFLLATDLKIYGGGNFGDAQETGSRSIMVWESSDLVTWSAQREIELAPENAGNLWAPEAYYDAERGEYVVYWASALYPADVPPAERTISTSYQRMMYATTQDFVTFSEPQPWIDEPQGSGRGMIDSTVAKEGDTYYRFTKDESYMGIRQESSTDLRRTHGVTEGDGWQMIAERVGFGQPNPWGGTFTGGEGPSVFKSNTDDTWYLLQDQPSYHGGQGYMLFETNDLSSGQWTANLDAELPPSPRHGTVLPITAAERDRLLAAYPPADPSGAPPVPDGAWVDEFDGAALGDRWTVVNPEPSALSVADGALTLRSQPGDTWQTTNSAKNVLMVDVPVGDFTAVTHLTAPVSLDFQGAGIIAWKDMDNYTRSGLAHVGFASGGPVIIETGVESGATFSSSFTGRPGSTSEYLRVKRTGDTITTSYWSGGVWVAAQSYTVGWDTTQVGLFALAAQNGTSHTATFDWFALAASAGQEVVPEGAFTVHASTARHLTSGDAGLSLVAERPSSTTALVVAGEGFAEEGTGRPVVVSDGGRLALGAPGAAPAALALTDAGGGRVIWHPRGDVDSGVTLGADGALVLGLRASAVRLTLDTVVVENHTVTLDTDGETTEISDDLYGVFYEDINYAADGGLYAELVRNRSFEFNSSDNRSFTGLTAWEKVERGATGSISVGTDTNRLNDSNRYYLTVNAAGPGVGVRNLGYNEGLAVEAGASYDFSVWARTATAQTLTVTIEDGGQVLATGTVGVAGDDTWAKHELTLTAGATSASARLVVTGGGAGTLRLDMVSLFPQDTWVGPVNGKSVLRKDLAEMTAALDPKFVRFPGGCVTNVGTFNTYLESGERRRTYQWKETIGPVEERPTNWNFWGYNQSYGIGYLEYFEFAEDLGASPLPVLSVGANGCGSNIPEMTDDAQIDRWVQDTVDLIEFANGSVDTEWGAVRASLGHPEPFDLKYIGLGNEENTDTFQANFPRFRDAVEAAWPDVTVISNSGPDDAGARFDELWDFNREQDVAMVDEHYYNEPSWFLENTERYDSYDREGPHVFLGEYASRGNTLANALSEAAYMTGIERNADVVELASYAPMFANEDYVQWAPDMMWFDNDESWASVNYYNQKMFMTNTGDEVVPSTHAGPVATPELSGGVFLSTWSTQAAYDDVTVTSSSTGEVLFSDTFADASQWSPATGSWSVVDGEYVQSAATVNDARSVVVDGYDRDWSNYTLELDARKVSGAEGFLVGFAAGGPNNYYWWNLGGWNNTRQALQRADGGGAGEIMAVEGHSIQTGRDYHVTVEVSGRVIKLYLDGQLQMTYTQPARESLYQVVTRDEDTGDVVLKVVNPTASTARTQVLVDGSMPVGSVAEITELSGLPGDTNTKADPESVVPVTRTWDGASEDFTYDFAPYSVTFVRLHDVPECAADFTVQSYGVGRHLAQVSLENTGDEPLAGWGLTWDLGDRRVISAWDAHVTRSGTLVTASNTKKNGNVAPGATVTFGYTATGSATQPDTVTLAGRRCTVE